MTAATRHGPRYYGLVGAVALAGFGAHAPQAHAQTSAGMMRAPAAAMSRPAPSGLQVYQASRFQAGNYGQSGYASPAYSAGRYERVYSGWQNPLYGAEYHNIQHHLSPYPYDQTRLYSYSRSYLYPYNYQDATTVPYYEVGSGGGGYPYSLQPQDQQNGNGNSPINPWAPAPVDDLSMGTAAAAAPAPSSVTVVVPDPQAVVTFQGQQTATKGTKRSYKTPPLTPGARYAYDVVARWRQNGADVEQRRTVDVAAGGAVTIDFTKPDALGN